MDTKLNPDPKKNYHIIWWITGISILLIFILFMVSFTFRDIIRWFLVLLSLSGVGILFYSLAGIFTQVKLKKWIVTILLIAISSFVYYETHKYPKVVQMQEDVLYVHPKPSTNEK